MLSRNDVRALKKARARIASNNCKYVCVALDRVAIRNPELATNCSQLRRYILLQLNGSDTLGLWQGNNFRIGWRTETQQRQDRLDWIDWMLGKK